jgi:hypothetical protein
MFSFPSSSHLPSRTRPAHQVNSNRQFSFSDPVAGKAQAEQTPVQFNSVGGFCFIPGGTERGKEVEVLGSIKAGFQYIATINQDQMEAMQQWLGGEYKTIITDSVTLELTDEATAGKLLGIEVDLEYESSRTRGSSSEKLD